jgi:hypothetical protein
LTFSGGRQRSNAEKTRRQKQQSLRRRRLRGMPVRKRDKNREIIEKRTAPSRQGLDLDFINLGLGFRWVMVLDRL